MTGSKEIKTDVSVFSIKPLAATNAICTASMMAFVTVIGPASRTLGLTAWQIGAVLTVGGLMWMLFSSSWGSASDRKGRRPTLIIGVLGFSLSYWLLCSLIAVSLQIQLNNEMLFLGLLLCRGAVGVFYASVPAIGQALIADHVPPERRSAALASVSAANGLGIVIGPAIAAALAHFDLTLSLVAIAIFPFVGLVFIRRVPSSSASLRSKGALSLRLLDLRIRRSIIAAFLAMFCVYIAQVNVGFLALDQLGLTSERATRTSGMALTAVGIAMISAQIIVRRIRWSSVHILRIGALLSAVGFGCITFASTSEELIAFYFVAAAGMGFVFPSFAAMASNAVQPHEQGAAAGIIGAAQGLGVVGGPLAATLLYEIEPRMPYLLASLLLMCLTLGSSKESVRDQR